MALQIDPSKFKMHQAKMLKLKVDPLKMKLFSKLMVNNAVTNTLNEAPVSDKIYNYKGKQYGRPLFRLLSNNSGKKIPGQQGLRFSKDNNGNLHLNAIVEAYREEVNVIPLDFRDVTLKLVYDANGKQETLPLSITQILPIKQTNVLKHIYAHAIIKPEHKEAIYEALVTGNKLSKLDINLNLWWQKPQQPVAARSRTPRRVPQRRTVDPNAWIKRLGNPFSIRNLKVRGTHIYNGNVRLMSFRSVADVKKAFNVIRHYNMSKKCSIGDSFHYFLSGNNAPVGGFKGEDCLGFNPAKIQVKNVNKRWKIVEGNRYLFDFGSNRTQATQAFKIIKHYGFDAVCYVGRPKPGMTYLKRTKPVRMQMLHMVARPYMVNPKVTAAAVAKPAQTPKPQKINIKAQIHMLYERKDPEVFQGFFAELETQEYKWEQGAKIDEQNASVLHSYYYRLTNDPNKVFFLPQVYRIGVNHNTGEPRVHINMYNKENATGEMEYRINMTFHVVPYFHPRAKKDLMKALDIKSEGKIKYVENLILSGYKEVSFELEDRFLSDNALFSEKFTEKISKIDPSTGFTITADHSLESFEVFKRELLTNGINIGKLYFDLEEEKDGEISVIRSNPINVELNFKKLENIPLHIEASTVSYGNHSIICGFNLLNKTDIPLNVGGVELTLLSSKDNHIYDVDSDLNTKIDAEDWPISIETNENKTIFIDDNDIDQLSDEHMVWNDLVCEPYSIRANIDSEKIMASVIDHASGDPEIWNLDVVCQLYKNWEDWTEEQRAPYKGIVGLIVDIKTDDGEEFSLELNRETPQGTIKMSRSVKQLLQSTNYDNRKYQYRLTNITLPPTPSGAWKTPESTSVNRLQVYPEL
ncbi:hypothetical protein [Pontimicrobium sp. MEBiC01747]